MLEIDSLEDIAALRESVDLECKLAQGHDGKGALPKEFWPTYSAFANTQGGDIFLGVREKSGGRFELAGVADPQKVLDEHGRMMSILDIHPRDLSQLFAGLVDKRLVLRNGAGRGTVYFLPDAHLEDIFTELQMAEGVASASSEPLDVSSGPLESSSGPLGVSSGPLGASSGPWEELRVLAEPVATKGKAPKAKVEGVILALCSRRPLRLDELTRLLNRSAESLRKHYLQPLVRARRLKLLYPTKPNHPDQAYVAEEPGDDQ